jgi:hypothetical protein
MTHNNIHIHNNSTLTLYYTLYTIVNAFATRESADIEELENRNYDEIENTSLLRFLVDMRGEESTSKQLRDDLMTMLIAGHETTAGMCVCCVLCLLLCVVCCVLSI